MTVISSELGAASPGLRRGAIGLREVLFQSITDMAPAAAIAASIPAGVAFAGGALPLSVLIALVALSLIHISIVNIHQRFAEKPGSYPLMVVATV